MLNILEYEIERFMEKIYIFVIVITVKLQILLNLKCIFAFAVILKHFLFFGRLTPLFITNLYSL